MQELPFSRRGAGGFALVLVILLTVYLPTVQTIPNGSDHYYMIDVGEAQIVLNTWGTLHMTGYPLYVIGGSALVSLLRAPGIAPAAAPALVSLLWGLIALALLYALAVHLTGRIIPAAAVTVLYGLTRTVWIHHVIAEVYTFELLILALLLMLALWRGPVRGRIRWLALVGGIGVGHHRAVAMSAPALLYAVWPELRAAPRRFRLLVESLLLGLGGLFLPYVYLPLRAHAGAGWVYGEPGTWRGFWEQFLGVEAGRFIGPPDSLAGLLANVDTINTVLITDLTLPGIAAGLVGLLWALRDDRLRRAAITLLLLGAASYGFHVLFYTDVLSALILPVTLALAFGWLFLIVRLEEAAVRLGQGRPARLLWGAAALLLAALLLRQNHSFITGLVRDDSGLQTIAQAAYTPPDATLMLAWGPRYFAVAFAREVDPSLGSDRLRDFTLVDHRAAFWHIVQNGMLVTPPYTFYNQPIPWWQERLGERVVLRAAAPYLVQIDTRPQRPADPPESFGVLAERVQCLPGLVALEVTWFTPDVPAEDLSVFVHALDADGALIAQGDQAAPVYGLRPLTGWEAGEAVRDVYPIAVDPAAVARLRYGLYRRTADGFDHRYEAELPVNCRLAGEIEMPG